MTEQYASSVNPSRRRHYYVSSRCSSISKANASDLLGNFQSFNYCNTDHTTSSEKTITLLLAEVYKFVTNYHKYDSFDSYNIFTVDVVMLKTYLVEKYDTQVPYCNPL